MYGAILCIHFVVDILNKFNIIILCSMYSAGSDTLYAPTRIWFMYQECGLRVSLIFEPTYVTTLYQGAIEGYDGNFFFIIAIAKTLGFI